MADTITGIRVLAAMAIERDWPTFREPDNADLMHLCDRLDIDFSGVLTVSAMHHDDESEG